MIHRNKLNFTWEGIEATAKSLERLKNAYQIHKQGEDIVEETIVEELEKRFHQAINDDLNMPLAMGVVWEVAKQEKKSPKFADLLAKFDSVLGIKIKEPMQKKEQEIEIPQEILELVEQRKEAREKKDWEKSDQIRDLLQSKGYQIKDTKEGIEIKKI